MGIRRFVLDLIFPPKCVFCRVILKRGESDFCADCEVKLPFCSAEHAVQPGVGYSICVSPLFFKGHVRDSLHRYKFQNAKHYRRGYSRLLAECIREYCSDRYDLISWIPVSEKRRKKRGYDQSMLLAMATALELSDVAVETLKKVRDTPPQSNLGKWDERAANIQDAYEISDAELVEGKRILLIDDIVTTGATLSEAAACLLAAGVSEVLCATLARGDVAKIAQLV